MDAQRVKGLTLRGSSWWLNAQVNGQRVRRSLGLPRECQRQAEAAVREFWLEVGNWGTPQRRPRASTITRRLTGKRKLPIACPQ